MDNALYNDILNSGNLHFFNHFDPSHFDHIESIEISDGNELLYASNLKSS